jgi:uncharacterized protein YndB with AHSA1/START domain
MDRDRHTAAGGKGLIMKKLMVLLFVMTVPLSAADPAQRIERDVVVHGSRADVWKAWTTNAGAKTFFAPDANIELRPGGAYEIFFNPDAPAGARGGEGNHVVTFEPERFIVFTWNAPTKFGPLRNERTYVMVRFDDAPNGSTRVRLTHFGWRPGHDWDEVYGYFDKAWDHVLGSLAKRFA